jgi:hypothetical protein
LQAIGCLLGPGRDEVGRHLTNAELDEAKTMVANFKPVEIDRAANEVDLKDIKWERVTPAQILANGNGITPDKLVLAFRRWDEA